VQTRKSDLEMIELKAELDPSLIPMLVVPAHQRVLPFG